MKEWKHDNITLLCADCMDVMQTIGDKKYSLCIADPPYAWQGKYGRKGGRWGSTFGNQFAEWDKPIDSKCIDEIFRVSRNQIIWGGNYFSLPPCRGFLIWDKKDKIPTLADCEYAWTSFDRNAKVFSSARNPGGLTGKPRTHPTQKPVQLYMWIMDNMCGEGDTIIDPFMGSGTSAVAAYETNRPYLGIEINPDYFDKAVERLEKHISTHPKLKEIL